MSAQYCSQIIEMSAPAAFMDSKFIRVSGVSPQLTPSQPPSWQRCTSAVRPKAYMRSHVLLNCVLRSQRSCHPHSISRVLENVRGPLKAVRVSCLHPRVQVALMRIRDPYHMFRISFTTGGSSLCSFLQVGTSFQAWNPGTAQHPWQLSF